MTNPLNIKTAVVGLLLAGLLILSLMCAQESRLAKEYDAFVDHLLTIQPQPQHTSLNPPAPAPAPIPSDEVESAIDKLKEFIQREEAKRLKQESEAPLLV